MSGTSKIAVRLIWVAVSTLLSLALAVWAAPGGQVTVFAAASLKNALEDVAQHWQQQTGNSMIVSLAGSSALARQIEQGAPADIFISANTDWMDHLEAKGLIRADSRLDLLQNSLVLIATGRSAAKVAITPGFDLAGMLGNEKLAMALVDAVPAGIYGKAALQNLGIWDKVAAKVAQTDNVRAALALVSTGEAPFGVVYATDASADTNVSVAGVFPADSYPAIIYPVAAVSDSTNPLNDAFLQFLTSEPARAAFLRHGFEMAH
ncbi:MAG: molybdate ABC transporter substrate-binding protein [Rhodobacteraceae bacterium]|nr:molybdate ABC transporter substrate-binding protein [Paracoccaceae bacterium]